MVTLAGAMLVAPLAARGQQPPLPVIGFLGTDSPERYADRLAAFREGLKEIGYVDGGNVAIDYRWAEGDNDRLPALAADLVRRQVAVIDDVSGCGAQGGDDEDTDCLLRGGRSRRDRARRHLNRPSGNLTGVTTSSAESAPKWLELLHEMVPTVRSRCAIPNLPQHCPSPMAATMARENNHLRWREAQPVAEVQLAPAFCNEIFFAPNWCCGKIFSRRFWPFLALARTWLVAPLRPTAIAAITS